MITAAPGQPLHDALHQIGEHSFSQLPVYEDGSYLGLLTTNAVAPVTADHASQLVDDRNDARVVA